MRTLIATSILALLTLAACDDADGPDFDADASADSVEGASLPDDVEAPGPSSLLVGDAWGPCDLVGSDTLGWRGCDEGLACLRPVSDDGLHVCAPLTTVPQNGTDCGNVLAPYGLGARVQGSLYCVADCLTDADCGPQRACSPASGYCAWVGE